MSKAVYIVDDDRDIREAIRFALELEGFTVTEAVEGRDALQRLRAAEGRVCLILLDLMMPGMNGWEFLRQQKADPQLARIPVCLISGARGVAQHAEELQTDGYLLKPVDLDMLLETVVRCCADGEAR